MREGLWIEQILNLLLGLKHDFHTPFQIGFFFGGCFWKRSIVSKIRKRILRKLWTRWLKIWLWGGESPQTMWRVEIILKILVIRLGVWVILSRIIPVRPIWLIHIVHNWVGVIRVRWGQSEKWIHLVGKILVIFHFITMITNKNKKQTNKQTKKKKKIQKQAYTRVDLDKDDA